MKLEITEKELVDLIVKRLGLREGHYKQDLTKLFDELLDETQIAQSVEDCRVKLRTLEIEHKKSIAAMNDHIKVIQANCGHRSTSFDPDPSGNSDSTTTCDICGKVL